MNNLKKSDLLFPEKVQMIECVLEEIHRMDKISIFTNLTSLILINCAIKRIYVYKFIDRFDYAQ